MRKLASRIAVFGLVFGVAGQTVAQESQAGILLEPIAGYSFGDLTNNATTPATEASLSGVTLGARAGVSFATLVFLAADVKLMTGGSLSSETPALEAGASSTLLGVVAGVNPPAIPLRAWIGYDPIASTKYNITSGGSGEFKLKGNGLHFGVAYTIIPLVSLNAEYYMLNYDEQEVVATGATATTDTGHNFFMISASVPLNL